MPYSHSPHSFPEKTNGRLEDTIIALALSVNELEHLKAGIHGDEYERTQESLEEMNRALVSLFVVRGKCVEDQVAQAKKEISQAQESSNADYLALAQRTLAFWQDRGVAFNNQLERARKGIK